MDTFVRALFAAESNLNNSENNNIRMNRYASFDRGKGNAFEQGKLSLRDLSKLALKNSEREQLSGQQELLENIINNHI